MEANIGFHQFVLLSVRLSDELVATSFVAEETLTNLSLVS